ncbi:hypothetical protein B9Z55_025098 [Caenorhabditis nigoni]|nr:hypothetical protein B9Z55_025098 [Caenorhabditis nigoni]
MRSNLEREDYDVTTLTNLQNTLLEIQQSKLNRIGNFAKEFLSPEGFTAENLWNTYRMWEELRNGKSPTRESDSMEVAYNPQKDSKFFRVFSVKKLDIITNFYWDLRRSIIVDPIELTSGLGRNHQFFGQRSISVASIDSDASSIVLSLGLERHNHLVRHRSILVASTGSNDGVEFTILEEGEFAEFEEMLEYETNRELRNSDSDQEESSNTTNSD